MNEMTVTPASPISPVSLIPATNAVQATAPAAHAAAMQDAMKTPALLGGWAVRGATNGLNTAKLFAVGMDMQRCNELLEMQTAIVKRLMLQQQTWLEGWAGLNRERAQIKGANTVSKLVEQEFNLVAQVGQLFIDQTTALVALQENIEISYSYWLSEKLGPLFSSARAT
ncbi:hypothetical protein [Paraburkholderia sp.]|uniref:hypothetical protein n=1 Tax=Paraburkholderia sp. TaxID=1926495 RepID=UPI0023997437|nr:hypothetical protein [Paraburkholderia sp.]MDE1179191.1 hypothetical protein [Paraburkholderia sp.]